jgi:hypothetical protein
MTGWSLRLQGLWPWHWGVSPYLGSLILLKYFKAYVHTVGACRPIWDLWSFRSISRSMAISPVHVAQFGIFDPFERFSARSHWMSATEISKFDKFLSLFIIWLGYKTWGLIKTFMVKSSLGIKPMKEKEYPLQKLYIKILNITLT